MTAGADPDEQEPLDAAGTAPEAFEQRTLTITAGQHGQRLDKVLVSLAPEFSRNHLQHLVDAGHVRVDGVVQDTASRKLRAGQALQLDLVPTDESRAFRPEAMSLDILYEDDHLIVLNKPAGLVVHPAAGNWQGTLLNGLLHHHPGAVRLPRAGIVHRLDKDTSGVMMVGKTLPAVTALVRDIAARAVHRRYVAICQGVPTTTRFTVDAPIGRDPKSRIRMAVVGSGREARTDVEVLGHRAGLNGTRGFAAIRCILHTGRTHQIRVHLAHRGHPLMADATYGGSPALGLERQALHAVRLALTHPISGDALAFDCPPPEDFTQAWQAVTAEEAA